MKLEIELDVPEGVIDETTRKAIRQDAILRLFSERKIPSSLACEMLSFSRMQLMELTRQRGIPYIEYSAGDLEEDLRDLDTFEQGLRDRTGSRE